MYQQFREKFSAFPVITLRDIYKSFPNFDNKNLVNWQKKGYITKLRNGYYLLNETKIDENLHYFIANKLYEPSYISMESALSYYSIIPEAVYENQSVSTRKTTSFITKLGSFNYRNIKPSLYFGYILITTNNQNSRIASLEKAILDFLYLRPDINNHSSFLELRWNIEELQKINMQTLENYLSLFSSQTLNEKIKLLKNYLNA